ncbi:hypothetical protein B0H10DRAFT_2345941 [Mycena sp. CBHHK59/15]|nr:hypothetical protein B0H10DRAFT_2345941 [Mycena sp. CBHHK59/15]
MRKINITKTSKLIVPNSDSEDDESDISQPRVGHRRTEFLHHQHIVHPGADGDTRHDYSTIETPASPTKPKRGPGVLLPDLPPNNVLGYDGEEEPVYDILGLGPDSREEDPAKAWKGRALRESDDPLGKWAASKVQIYLDEFVRGDGRGDYMDEEWCNICDVEPAVYRCIDCHTDDLYCKECIVQVHRDNPLHGVQAWNLTEQMFEETTLKKLGLRIQLGHGRLGKGMRGRCVLPEHAVDDDFVVVDSHKIHEVAVDFCNCASAQPHDIQLLRARWYPATGKSPRSAATFRLLHRFHLMSLESKCSSYEFYHSIARETDNTGTVPVRDRYDEFMRMGREWRHLKMLKRSGRGHDPSGVKGTKSGECALLCPACPQPGKNLPENWKDVPNDRRFLYALFLALDANFRMRRKKVSSEEKDPSLGDGWSFFCQITAYMEYLKKYWHQSQERSTCVAHDAVDKPDKESRGTASSGIATVDCARHNMKRPNAVGDLQLGERYILLQYTIEIEELYVSYDIACQWHKNIWERMKNFDSSIQFKEGKKFVVFLIPKFHLPAHIEACNILFSFNLTRFVGMTDGEAPERGWSHLNPLAASTAEMGPGSRRDLINDSFNDWNHKKIIAFGRLMLRKIAKAVPEMITSSVELEDLELSLPRTAVEEWTREMEAWEADASQPNPFKPRVQHKTMQAVRLAMAEEVKEEMDLDALEGLVVRDDMHPTEMVSMGLQLEELQRTLAFDLAGVGNHPSTEQLTTMTERTNKLRRKLLSWMDIQLGFMPHVALLRAEEDRARRRIAATQPQPGIQVQHMALWLPSAIQGREECDVALYEYEYRLREGQAYEALEDVRQQLLLRTHQYKQKDRYARGVKANTRAQTKIKRLDERIRRTAERYRAAWRALMGLGKILERSEWEKTLRPLAAEDVRADAKDVAKRRMSWIWCLTALRIEWAKTRATALRWAEEVDLLEEEMRRITQFQKWRAECHAYREGNRAYARKQADIQRKLSAQFQDEWKDVADFISMGRTALGILPPDEEYCPPVDPDAGSDELPVPPRRHRSGEGEL